MDVMSYGGEVERELGKGASVQAALRASRGAAGP